MARAADDSMLRIIARLQMTLEVVPDAAVAVDDQGRIATANAHVERLFGYTRDELVGSFVEVLVPDGLRDRHTSHRGGYVAHPRTRAMGEGLDLSGRRKNGSSFHVDIMLSPIRIEDQLFTVAAVRDVTGRRRSEEKFRAFLESAPDAVVVIDAAGRISIVNAQTERLFGWTREELLGEHVEMLLPERYRDVHAHHRGRYLIDPRTRPMGVGLDLYGLRKDGTEFPVDISLSPIDSEDGTLLTAAIRDVTERKRWEVLREQFVANAAHELRTPLAVISAIAEMLEQNITDMKAGDVADAFAALRRQGQRMTALVTNLLDLSQIESGHTNLELRPVNVAAVTERALEGTRAPDGAQVQTDVPADLRVLADESRLEQVVTNLLTNAYRYGGPHVRVSASAAPESVDLVVSDDGPGIPPDLLPRLFEPFSRGTDAHTLGGTGLGLALSRRIVEAFGGRIRLDGGAHRGARFVVRLRRAP